MIPKVSSREINSQTPPLKFGYKPDARGNQFGGKHWNPVPSLPRFGNPTGGRTWELGNGISQGKLRDSRGDSRGLPPQGFGNRHFPWEMPFPRGARDGNHFGHCPTMGINRPSLIPAPRDTPPFLYPCKQNVALHSAELKGPR